MTRLIPIATVFMLANGPVAAEEILFCSDQDASGFQFKGGQGKRMGYNSQRFVVKIISPTRRTIKYPTLSSPTIYSCQKRTGILFCTNTELQSTNPIIFKGNNYSRSNIFSENVGGDPDLIVAYGTCAKF